MARTANAVALPVGLTEQQRAELLANRNAARHEKNAVASAARRCRLRVIAAIDKRIDRGRATPEEDAAMRAWFERVTGTRKPPMVWPSKGPQWDTPS